MKVRAAKLLNVAIFAALIAAAALALTKNARAAASSNELAISGEKVALATWTYTDRSLSDFVRLFELSPKDATANLPKSKKTKLNLAQKPSLSNKLQNSEPLINVLYTKLAYLSSEADVVSLRWNQGDNQEVNEFVAEATKKLGKVNDTESNGTVLGAANYLSKNWDWQSAQEFKEQSLMLTKQIEQLKEEMQTSGHSAATYSQLATLTWQFERLGGLLGTPEDVLDAQTIHGDFNETKKSSTILANKTKELKDLFSNWSLLAPQSKLERVQSLVGEIQATNQIPLGGFIPVSSISSDIELKNNAFAALGLVRANQLLLVQGSDHAIKSDWIELGSMVFKSMISNPSDTSLKVEKIGYFLPKEVTKKDIIKVSDGLSITLDKKKQQYFVSGSIQLLPKETKTMEVRVNDVWKIDGNEIARLKNETGQLMENTDALATLPYFSKSRVLGDKTSASLELAEEKSKANWTTPEEKIAAFSEAEKNLASAKKSLGELEEFEKFAPLNNAVRMLVSKISTTPPILIVALFLAIVSIPIFLTKAGGKKKSLQSSLSV